MTQEEIWAVLSRNILAVLTDVDAAAVRPSRSLLDLGANSLDRVDILSGTVDELNLETAEPELASAPDLGAMVRILHAYGGTG